MKTDNNNTVKNFENLVIAIMQKAVADFNCEDNTLSSREKVMLHYEAIDFFNGEYCNMLLSIVSDTLTGETLLEMAEKNDFPLCNLL